MESNVGEPKFVQNSNANASLPTQKKNTTNKRTKQEFA